MSEEAKESEQPQAVQVYKAADVASFFNVSGQQHLATFDPTTADGAKMLISATMGECTDIKDTLNTEIAISHLYAHPAQRVDPATGEVSSWIRIVLLTPDGKAISCGSMGIGKSLGLISLMRGNPPWIPAVRCTVKAEDIGGGRNFYKLIPSVESVVNKPTKPRR